MKPGLLELANHGTLFLDEAGGLDQRLRAKVVRAVEHGALHRIGAARSTRVDVRLVAAGSEHLKDELGACQISVPALRERPEDIEVLACHFLSQQNPELRFASDAMMALYSYQWPGNVRELRNTVLRSAMMAKGPLLHADDIVFSPQPNLTERVHDFGVDGVEPAMIRLALAEAHGHRQRAADALGISKATLSRRMRLHGLHGNETIAGRIG